MADIVHPDPFTMNQTPSPLRETLVAEIVAESFPASDAPTWNATHAGGPALRPQSLERGPELRGHLREDLDRLSGRPGVVDAGRSLDEAIPSADPRQDAREAYLVEALLAAGRALVRHPIPGLASAYDVETELKGAVHDAPPVVIASNYDGPDATATAMLLAVARALEGATLRRAVKVVALREVSDAVGRLGEYLGRTASRPHVLLSLGRMGLARAGSSPATFCSSWRSRSLVRAAHRAFAARSRIESRSWVLPSWLPLHRAEDHVAWRLEIPAITVADHPPWRNGRSTDPPDVDRMAAAVPGLVAAIEQLAGGRV